jgi:hypothetical protein
MSISILGARERRLVINCARLELDETLARQTRELLRGELDWDQTVLFAEAHSVAPLLHRQLERLDGWAGVPPPARRRLLQLTHRTGYRNRLYAAALRDLLDLFAEDGVPVLVLKGLSLVELIYGDLSLRPLIDLNLLVPGPHLERARELLLRRGYVETLSRNSSFYRWCHSHLTIEKPDQFRLFLMLQWELVTWPRMHAIDLPRVWADAQPVRLAGRDARIPSPIDLVLYLCLQADKYAIVNALAVDRRDPAEYVFDERTYNRLVRFTDLHEVIHRHREGIDWSELTGRARAAGIEESAYGSLKFAERLFGTPVPREVLADLRPVRYRWPRRVLSRWSLGPEPGNSSSGPPGVPRRWIKLLQLIDFVFPRRDIVRRRYRQLWGGPPRLAYPWHVSASLLRCASRLPGWTFERARERLVRHPRRGAGGPVSAGVPFTSQGLGPT